MGRRAKVVLSKHDAADERLLIDLFNFLGVWLVKGPGT